MQSLKLWYALILRPSPWRVVLMIVLAPAVVIGMRLVGANNDPFLVANYLGIMGGSMGNAAGMGLIRPYVEYVAGLPLDRASARTLPYMLAFISALLMAASFIVLEYSGANNFAARAILVFLDGDLTRAPLGYPSAWPPLGALGWTVFAFFAGTLAGDVARFDPHGPAENSPGVKAFIFVVFLGIALATWIGTYKMISELSPLDPHGSACITGLVLIPLAIPLAVILRKRVIRRDTDDYPLAAVQ